MVLDNCTFINNEAKMNGGAIYTEGTVTVNANQADREYNSFFNNNKATDQSAGAIYARYINLKNAEFKDNIAKYNGGATYSFYETNATNCLFVSNKAGSSDGGAVYAVHDAYIYNSTFKDNYAEDYGGAVYAGYVIINPNEEGLTTSTYFIENKAGDNKGGAVYVTSDAYGRNVAFTKNNALEDGGAVYAEMMFILQTRYLNPTRQKAQKQ